MPLFRNVNAVSVIYFQNGSTSPTKSLNDRTSLSPKYKRQQSPVDILKLTAEDSDNDSGKVNSQLITSLCILYSILL